ncbi:uncharacterized protein LAESUDRAFT_757704 [Laetiporus sulphureus 93-53]|uniref:Uncharacterized protein n=1 Tax=Laetiporus sulphureus 93-53 TaxID=1314785 RepID=A0A165F654_9APHY|nr:uncharacterized protein LAESUDRAFT_757704 [Laetiporus sulphureus 93-53]KZT08468.1 hypothetical protein LAESUDRAFT_757704 [Laetiporus sulphureus 93-53]
MSTCATLSSTLHLTPLLSAIGFDSAASYCEELPIDSVFVSPYSNPLGYTFARYVPTWAITCPIPGNLSIGMSVTIVLMVDDSIIMRGVVAEACGEDEHDVFLYIETKDGHPIGVLASPKSWVSLLDTQQPQLVTSNPLCLVLHYEICYGFFRVLPIILFHTVSRPVSENRVTSPPTPTPLTSFADVIRFRRPRVPRRHCRKVAPVA